MVTKKCFCGVTLSVIIAALVFYAKLSERLIRSKSNIRHFVSPKGEMFVQEESKKYLFGSHQWRKSMPEIALLLNQAESDLIDLNLALKNTTDPKHVEVSVEKSVYAVTEVVTGRIQARNYFGDNKAYGGDYFRARLVRLNERGNEDGIVPVTVKDHANGTYTWSTTVPWPGSSIQLHLELVHPSEAVLYLILKTNSTVPNSIGFVGTYPSGARVDCGIHLRITDSCDFSEPHAGSVWRCQRLANETCPRELIWSKRVGKPPVHPGRRELYDTKQNRDILVKNNVSIKSVQPPQQKDRAVPIGYFENGQWIAPSCGTTSFDEQRARRCWTNKSLYLIGDSTMRQWYKYLVRSLVLNDTGPDNSIAWSHSRLGRDEEHNISVHYRAHGIPLHNPGPPSSRPFIVDTLDDITRAEGAAIVFNLGAHFALYDPSVFMQRLTAIKNALLQLIRRRPRIKVYLRLGIRFKQPATFLPSEWYLYRFDRIMLDTFAGLDFLEYIDTWAITTARTQIDVHAKMETIQTFLGGLFSRMCN